MLNDFINITGKLKITRLDNGQVFEITNKINNNLKKAIGSLICKDPSITDRNKLYISAMRIYGVANYSELSSIPAATASDSFPGSGDRLGYINKTLASGDLIATANILTGTNLFTATVYNDDNIGSNSTYYISDLFLVGINSDGNEEPWAHVLAPSDSAVIGLLKTPSISYRIDWYIIFNQE